KANPALPAIPADWEAVVESAVAARKAGASIVHLHGPVDHKGKTIPDGWARLAEDIRKRCDVLIDFGRASSPLEGPQTLLRLCQDPAQETRTLWASVYPNTTTPACGASAMSSSFIRALSWKNTPAVVWKPVSSRAWKSGTSAESGTSTIWLPRASW